MPRKPKHGPARCAGCGQLYADFRTGLSFSEVRTQFWRADADPKTWHPKRRNTVLGRWHEIKTHLWNEHVEGCTTYNERKAA